MTYIFCYISYLKVYDKQAVSFTCLQNALSLDIISFDSVTRYSSHTRYLLLYQLRHKEHLKSYDGLVYLLCITGAFPAIVSLSFALYLIIYAAV